MVEATGARPQEEEVNKLQTAVGVRLGLALAGLSVPALRREEGQTFVEYAMILALIGVALTGALIFLHDKIASAYTAVANACCT